MDKLFVIALCALLCACGKRPDAEAESPSENYYVGRHSVAKEFRLEDGTRCVTYANGISCEWKCRP